MGEIIEIFKCPNCDMMTIMPEIEHKGIPCRICGRCGFIIPIIKGGKDATAQGF
jgi:uncharacterized paraquat-inducible protein A